jgi:predicted alpha/beta superfamily hydrolase
MKNIKIHELPIITTNNYRKIRVLLPDNYEHVSDFYPVLYMQDGQNLFDDDLSYGGISWGIYETLKKHNLDQIIVVGIDNSDLRLFEYSPFLSVDEVKKITKIQTGGLGDIYASFIIDQVIPFIDSNYRTKNSYEYRYIAGSSMGAYISCYIANKYKNMFKVVGVFSLASWFNEEKFLNFLNSVEIDTNQRYFISIGSNESSDLSNKNFSEIYLNNSRNLKKLLIDKKIKDIYYIETDDKHHETAWRKMFNNFILWINKKD